MQPPRKVWSDPAGDQEPGAPDITTVAVSDNGPGRLTIAVGIPGREQLLVDEYLEVYFDTDRDSIFDYAAQLDGTAGAVKLYVYRPNGDTWQSFASSVEAAWSRQRTQVELDLREIGNPRSFNFYVRTEGGDQIRQRPLDRRQGTQPRHLELRGQRGQRPSAPAEAEVVVDRPGGRPGLLGA